MKVIIAGSTGMIGSLILDHCLQSNKITELVDLVRREKDPIEIQKLKRVLIKDFKHYDQRDDLFKNIDAAFFCIGVYTGQVSNELFEEITVDYAVNFAKMLAVNSPNARLCLLSGAGADRTEKSRTAFARYKGIAENQISDLGLQFHTFRPGYIYPVEPRKEPSFMYGLLRTLYPLIRLFGRNASIKSTELAEAMFQVGLSGAESEVLENKDIIDQISKNA